jgi:hypothetical protein
MAKKIESKENLPAVVASQLTSSSMAELANYDAEMFKDVVLDVAENKELFKNDLLIPKIWLVQTMSDLRKEKKADEGDFVDSQTAEILAASGESLKLIVLKTFKRWHTFEVTATGKEFLSSEIMVLGKNHDLKYEDVLDGKNIVRRQVISAYVLIERDALRGINKPYIIDFASTSKYAGRILVSDIATLNQKGLPSFTGIFEMSADEQDFEKGSAFVRKIKFFGFVPKTAMPYLLDCYKGLEAIENQIIFDDSDLIKNSNAEDDSKVNKKADVASEKI